MDGQPESRPTISPSTVTNKRSIADVNGKESEPLPLRFSRPVLRRATKTYGGRKAAGRTSLATGPTAGPLNAIYENNDEAKVKED